MPNLAQAFNQFKENLNLSKNVRKQLTERQTKLRGALVKDPLINNVFISGSVARGTPIPPVNDLDLIAEFKQPKGSPRHTLDYMQALLSKIYPKATIRRQDKSIGIRFPDIAFDIVPGFHRAPKGLLIASSEEKWIPTDPKQHKIYAGQRDQACGQMAIPLVKMLKCWSRHKRLRIRSFHLETLILKNLDGKPSSYAEGARLLFATLANQMSNPCKDPAGLGRLDDGYRTSGEIELARNTAKQAAKDMKLAIALDASGDSNKAIKICREVFGTPFPG